VLGHLWNGNLRLANVGSFKGLFKRRAFDHLYFYRWCLESSSKSFVDVDVLLGLIRPKNEIFVKSCEDLLSFQGVDPLFRESL
jgi:hypothetical protein